MLTGSELGKSSDKWWPCVHSLMKNDCSTNQNARFVIAVGFYAFRNFIVHWVSCLLTKLQKKQEMQKKKALEINPSWVAKSLVAFKGYSTLIHEHPSNFHTRGVFVPLIDLVFTLFGLIHWLSSLLQSKNKTNCPCVPFWCRRRLAALEYYLQSLYGCFLLFFFFLTMFRAGSDKHVQISEHFWQRLTQLYIWRRYN